MKPDLAELRGLLERATPGPWEACGLGDYGDFDGESRVLLGDDTRIAVFNHGGNEANREECDANIDLVAAVINMLPDLLNLAEAGMGAGWRDIESAPKDGTQIIAWVRHSTWKFAPDDDKARWEGPVIAHWIEHNGGGWTWHGHLGEFLGWMPVSDFNLPAPPKEGRDG